MSIQKLPSGQYRAQVYDPASGKNVSVSKVLNPAEMRKLGSGNGTTFRLKTCAKQARERAREKLSTRRSGKTVAEFRDTWLTDPLFLRPKRSTMIHNAERTKAFAERYGALALTAVDDEIVSEWLAGGRRNGCVPALRAMFNDARKAKAGRLLVTNPFADLGIERTHGNKHRQPPDEKLMWRMVEVATKPNSKTGRLLVPPSFGDYLETACFTAMRPGELDALQWPQIRWKDGEIDVTIQWNATVGEFTEPKYGPYKVALVGHAREVLLRAKARRDNDSQFVFATTRGTHYTPSSRNHHWNRVRIKADIEDMTLYLATRHYFGWYAVNVLGLDTAIVAAQLGHKDGGKLVEELYGHPEISRRLAKVREAFAATGQVRPLRAVEGGESA